MKPAPKTLAGRIFLTFAAIQVALLLLGVGYGERRLRQFHSDQIERRLGTAAELLTGAATEVLTRVDDDAPFPPLLTSVDGSKLRVTLIAADGEVRFDNVSKPPIANHGQRPEVVQARQEGEGAAFRTSATTSIATLYVARRIDFADGGHGFLRVGTAVETVQREFSLVASGLLLGLAAALFLGLLGTAFVSRWLARPLESIQVRAAELAQGDLEGKVRVRGPVEVRRIANSLNRMAKELRARIELVERDRRETSAIHASMSEGVVAVDPDERVLLMNDAAARLLGLPRPLEVGSELWREVRFPDLELALRGALAGAPEWHGDAPSPAVENRILALSATRVEPDVGAVALLYDVTELRRLDKVRIDFVANVSHEMRTPLTAVLGAIETLEDPATTKEEATRFLDIARRNAVRMQAIVADLLELSRIESEGDRIPMEKIPLENPVRSAMRALSGTAEAKGVALDYADPPHRPFLITGNEKRLEQVFTNLIENAIKYTPAGGSVRVRYLEGGSAVTVEVADSGIGMPSESLPRIFERFYRVDKSRSREMGGTGLGLAIVKHCVRAHNGRVSVRSEEGTGTTFSVTLPIDGNGGEEQGRARESTREQGRGR